MVLSPLGAATGTVRVEGRPPGYGSIVSIGPPPVVPPTYHPLRSARSIQLSIYMHALYNPAPGSSTTSVATLHSAHAACLPCWAGGAQPPVLVKVDERDTGIVRADLSDHLNVIRSAISSMRL